MLTLHDGTEHRGTIDEFSTSAEAEFLRFSGSVSLIRLDEIVGVRVAELT